MELDFSFLADNAQVVNGKLYVMGGAFDTIKAKKMPVIHPQLSFVMRLLFSPAEMGRTHKLEVNLMDEDANRLTSVVGELKVGKKVPGLPKGWKQSFIRVLNFQNLAFKKAGNYCFEIVVNNNSVKSILLRIVNELDL